MRRHQFKSVWTSSPGDKNSTPLPELPWKPTEGRPKTHWLEKMKFFFLWLLLLPILPLLVLYVWWICRDLSFGGDIDPSDPPAPPTQVIDKGCLPYSVQLSGIFFRWHEVNYLQTGSNFWRTFEDGPWKWDAHSRFAGKGWNCGHYFSLSKKAAAEEAQFLGHETSKGSEMLEIKATFPSVLDLTDLDNIQEVFKHCVRDPQNVEQWRSLRLFARLMHGKPSGNAYTTAIGYWAAKQGYDGVLFCSARVAPLLKSDLFSVTNPNILSPEDREAYREILGLNYLNLVVFSGLRLAVQVSSYVVGSQVLQANPHYGANLSEFNHLTQYGSIYQEEQWEKMYYPPDLGEYVWQSDDPDIFDVDDYNKNLKKRREKM